MYAGSANFSRMHEVKSMGNFCVAAVTSSTNAPAPATTVYPQYTSGGSILVPQRGTASADVTQPSYDTGSGAVGHFVMSYNVGRISHGQYVMKVRFHTTRLRFRYLTTYYSSLEVTVIVCVFLY